MSPLDAISIPDKTYFKIGEVAKLLDLEPYVLRYWESEFDVLDPDKTDSGQRVYQREDIELIVQIRDLLYNEMFTIAGARRQLELEREGKPCYASAATGAEPEQAEQLERIEELEAELAEAHQTIARLEEKQSKATGGLDPRLVRGLREQIEGLARLGQRPV